MTFTIRRCQPGDEPALFKVFFSAIHLVAVHDYSSEQVHAWAPLDHDKAGWVERIQKLQPFVAWLDGQPVGYADLQPDGYIDHFYVAGEHSRQGVGDRLMARLNQEADALGIAELTSDVSKTAVPFFARHGFEVVRLQFPVHKGVVFENALMRKTLAGSSSQG